MKTFLQWLEATDNPYAGAGGSGSYTSTRGEPIEVPPRRPDASSGKVAHHYAQTQSFRDFEVDDAVERLLALDDEQLARAYHQISDDARWQNLSGVGKKIPLAIRSPGIASDKAVG